jgi:hypothetical protein
MNPFRRLFLLNASVFACSAALASEETFSTMRPAAAASSKPYDVDRKFNADGTPRRFPGNTIISHIPLATPASEALIAVRDTLKQHPFSRDLAFTPPSSYHMTVFEGVIDVLRTPGYWPADLPANAPLDVCTRQFEDKLAGFRLDTPLPLRMRIADFSVRQDSGATIRLSPFDADEERNIRRLRDRLSDLLQIRARDHVQYGFHVTLAYLVNWMSAAETIDYAATQRDCLAFLQSRVPVLEFGAPEFCVFNDMLAFDTQFLIGQSQRIAPHAASRQNAVENGGIAHNN